MLWRGDGGAGIVSKLLCVQGQGVDKPPASGAPYSEGQISLFQTEHAGVLGD